MTPTRTPQQCLTPGSSTDDVTITWENFAFGDDSTMDGKSAYVERPASAETDDAAAADQDLLENRRRNILLMQLASDDTDDMEAPDQEFGIC